MAASRRGWVGAALTCALVLGGTGCGPSPAGDDAQPAAVTPVPAPAPRTATASEAAAPDPIPTTSPSGVATPAQAERGAHQPVDAGGPEALYEPVSFGRFTLDELIPTAVEDLEAFWAQTFSSAWPELIYTGPSLVRGYAAGDDPPVTCGVNGSQATGNAFYCRQDQRIVYDEDALRSWHDDYGDFAAVSVLAHEWGHHIQQLANPAGAAYTIQAELQADCYAGVYAAHAGTASGLFALEAGDLEEAASFFFALGGDNANWFDPGDHGLPVERMDAYLAGHAAADARVCDQMAEYRPGFVEEVGDYLIAFPRSAQVAWISDGLTLEAHLLTPFPGIVRTRAVDLDARRTALGQIEDVVAWWTERSSPMEPIGGLDDLSGQDLYIAGGTTAAGMQYRQESSRGPLHGYVVLLARGGSGLFIDVYGDGEPPVDEDGWKPLYGQVASLISGLR